MIVCDYSSDNHRCDLYVYEDDAGGYMIHCAADRIVGAVPEIDAAAHPEVVVEMVRAQEDYVVRAKREPIPSGLAGVTWRAPTVNQLKANLSYLRHFGFRVPDAVLATVDAMIAGHADG